MADWRMLLAVSYFIGTVLGAWVIGPIVFRVYDLYLGTCRWGRSKHLWKGPLFGIIERAIYMGVLTLGKPAGSLVALGGIVAFKAYERQRSGDYYGFDIYLIGTGLSLMWAFYGYGLAWVALNRLEGYYWVEAAIIGLAAFLLVLWWLNSHSTPQCPTRPCPLVWLMKRLRDAGDAKNRCHAAVVVTVASFLLFWWGSSLLARLDP